MRTYAVAFCLALIVSALTTPVVTWLAHRYGWLDQPSEARKIHTVAVPRLGGVAVVLAFFMPLLGLALWENRVSNLLYSDQRLVLGLVGGALAIVLLGVYDDLRGAGAKLKLTVQTGVAVGIWLCGFRIELLGNPIGEAFDLGVFSLPLTVIWMVGVINALNLIDGLDGLASGVALFATVVLFGVAFVDNMTLLCLITVALGGALVGFLFWNFNPAKIFLGDSGSMFLGFVLGAVSIWTQHKGTTAVALLIPVLALGLPILDTTLSFVRRVKNGKSPFEADREHLHHRLLALGLSHRNAVLTLYTASIVFGLGALSLLDTRATHRAIALSTVVAVAMILVRRVGVFRPPGLARSYAVSAGRDELRRVARSIRSATTSEHTWSLMVPLFPRLGAEAARLTWVKDPGSTGAAPVAEGAERRASVFSWRADAQVHWPIERPEALPNARVVALTSEDRTLGELVVVFPRGSGGERDPSVRLYLELLAEALVDHRDAADALAVRPPGVVSFAEARRHQVAH
ncbi:MAG: MraY family glycosyltransferase [Myxococcota bacterium]